MPHDSSSNAPSSVRTSASAPATPPSEATPNESTTLGESKFLTQQAADAKAAISRVVDDIKNELSHSVDPAAWMKVHPWATMGAAAVAGFVAAAVAIPSKEQAALRRLAEIEKALMPHGRDPLESLNGDAARRVASGQKSFWSGLAAQVLQAVQPVLMSAITAGVTAKAVDQDQPTGGNNPAAQAAANSGAAPQPTTSGSGGADPSI